ncbi:zinc-ribbon domain-containing protein [Streptomyces sp. H10-C2]|uniref:zinc ribbon domain-containing protein n=1 Tax=unclassified Streptomyces TaxID=2593676 RepID=UPI0024BAF47C|nr:MULTISPECIES: zinc ribbon domain-containing protein [unclassified Streptomyces]MDJ0341985.1 zinc-ribbon domain-containing protein [Streptomyces sp. PH10-H1]MDJ0369958.1 zinc-ribbon domain-containing protein [Streptomyces sp. H10-C2]MDJ0370041.1 zinc-ribbon domain-containing protein [Streptomyces sp. H10-C2]
MPFCPACGNASSDEARFCMKCGRELGQPPIPGQGQPPPVPGQPPAPGQPPLPPGTPPAYPPPAYPPPPYAPTAYAPTAYVAVPQQPSPAGLFIRRTVSGDWTGPLKAGLWPTALLLAIAGLLASVSTTSFDGLDVGYGDRLRFFLAMILQGIGGTVGYTLGSDSGRSTYGDGSGYPDPYSPSLTTSSQAGSTLSVVPLVITVLWGLALVLALRHLRRTQTGAEAAVRVAVVCTAGAVILALIGQPSVTQSNGRKTDITSGPLTVLLWTFVLSLVTALFVLCRDRLDGPLSTSPGLASAVRALRAALLALGIGVAVCAVILLVVLADHSGEMNSSAWFASVLLLGNAGVSALGVAWGVPVEANRVGSSYTVESFGLSDLSQFGDGWAVPGALAAGVVCALVLGVVAVRRFAERRDQWLTAGFYVALFVLLIAIGGVTAEFSGYSGGSRYSSPIATGTGVSSSVPEALLFGLLWAFGGVLAVTFIRIVRAGGQGGAPGYPPGYAAPYVPPYGGPYGPASGLPVQPVQPGQPVQPLEQGRPGQPAAFSSEPIVGDTTAQAVLPAPPAYGPTEPDLLLHLQAGPEDPVPGGRRKRLLLIGLIMLGAFAIGGAATAAVIVVKRHDDKPAEPTPSSSASVTPGDDTAPSGEASPSDAPTDDVTPTGDATPTGNPEPSVTPVSASTEVSKDASPRPASGLPTRGYTHRVVLPR